MSALGHKRTYAVQQPMSALLSIATAKADFPQKAMSALPPKADMCSAQADVRFVPKADISASLDHLVGDGEHSWRHLDAERSGRMKVDDELEFGRLQHWQVGGLYALEDAAGIDADLTKRVREVGSVAHQPAGCDKIAIPINRRNPVARRQNGKLHAAVPEEGVGSDEESIGALARKSGKSSIDLADRRGVED